MKNKSLLRSFSFMVAKRAFDEISKVRLASQIVKFEIDENFIR